MLQTAKENFDKLEERIISINSNNYNVNCMREMIYSLACSGKPTLIMATGGSKIVAYYLQFLLERIVYDGVICEVIEPRDYLYKCDRNSFSNLVVISASGNTNGIKEALSDFKGKKFLVSEKQHKGDFEVISWGNDSYDSEHSFISLATSLGPISMMLDTTIGYGGFRMEIIDEQIEKVNNLISKLLQKCREKISKLNFSFKDANIVNIMSGYDTRCSSFALESNLVEAGLCAPIIHDKGSFCHGRSNIVDNNTPIIYLSHEQKKFDKFLIHTMSEEWSNILEINTSDLSDQDYIWREYYLLLQMYYLSKKIAEDKGEDLTKPNYNRKIIKPLYEYRGRL